MKIRAQLALSFLGFTVIPLAGLTLYSYHTSIRAFRNVVQEESAGLAKEMSLRMEAVTRDLQHRLDQLDREPFYHLAKKQEKPVLPAADLYAEIFGRIGDMAACVESLEFPMGSPPAPKLAGPPPPPAPVSPETGVPSAAAWEEGDPDSVVVYMEGTESSGRGEKGAQPQVEHEANRVVVKWAGPGRPPRIRPAEAKEAGLSQAELDKIIADAKRAAREAQIEQQEQQKAAAEIRRKYGDLTSFAQREKSRALAKARMEIMVDHDRGPGEKKAGPIRAKIRSDEILRRIFEQGQFAHGEIQFAVDQSGNVHTPREAEVEELFKLGFQPSAQARVPDNLTDDWVVASVKEPVSGMTFGIARPIGQRLQELKMTAWRNMGVGFAFIGLALLGIIPVSGRMTRRVKTLTHGVERLAAGDLATRVEMSSSDEFGTLAAAFNQMAAELAEQQKRLVEQERLEKELEMCRRIQEVLLPREPLRVGFAEAKGVSIPARQVGGDFFNYFVLPEGDVALLMGDVSGKGVPAALLMANLQATLRAKLQVERDLARLARDVDEEIARQTEPQTYATLFIGIISRDGRTLRWVNAGHNPQFILAADGRLQSLQSTGKPVGLLPGDGYEEKTVELRHGDFLFLYTDGLVEAEDPAGDEFGTERLEGVLLAQRDRTIDQIVGATIEAVKQHRAGTEAGDDATLLALKVA